MPTRATNQPNSSSSILKIMNRIFETKSIATIKLVLYLVTSLKMSVHWQKPQCTMSDYRIIMSPFMLKKNSTSLFIAFLAIATTSLLSAQDKPRPAEQIVLVEKIFIEAMREKVLGNYDEAISLYEEVLRKDKTNHAALFEIALLQKSKRDEVKATEYAAKAIALSPQNLHYATFYAELLTKNGDLKNAANQYEQLVKRYPSNEQLYYEWASVLAKGGKIEQAVKVYDQLEKQMGVRKDISLKKYQVWLELKKMPKAIAELESYLKANSTDLEIYEQLAKTYEQNGQKQEALAVYEKMKAAAPGDARASLLLAGQASSGGGDLEKLKGLESLVGKADASLNDKITAILPYLSKLNHDSDPNVVASLANIGQKLKEAHPSDPRAIQLLGDVHFYAGNFKEAVTNYEATLDLAPNKLDIWQNLMSALYQSGQKVKLLKMSDEVISLFPNQPFGYLYNGMASTKMDKPLEAISSLEAGVQLCKSQPILKSQFDVALAAANMKLGKTAEGDKLLEEALKGAPTDPFVLSEAASYLVKKNNQIERAAELAQKSLSISKNNIPLLHTYSLILIRKKDYPKAQEVLLSALSKDGEQSVELLETYGDLLFRMDKTADAVTYWKKAMDKGGQSEVLNTKVKTQRLIEE